MTTDSWLDQAKRDEEKLVALVASFHPATQRRRLKPAMRITAPNPEAARRVVEAKIRKETENTDPVAQLREAIAGRDLNKVNAILNAAWFGVPESTDCWDLEGFKEAVALMEDLPEEDTREQGGPEHD